MYDLFSLSLEYLFRRLYGFLDAFRFFYAGNFLFTKLRAPLRLSGSLIAVSIFLRITAVRRTIFYANNIDNSSSAGACYSRIQVSVGRVAARLLDASSKTGSRREDSGRD